MTSLADSLASTGMIPPVSGNDLQPPSDAANQNKQKPLASSESSILAAGDKDIESGIKKLDALNPPLPPQFKEAPKMESSDPVQQGYVSAIGIMGAIGSAFTRHPMTNSMNSAAAVVNAMKSGDQESFKQSMEKWKIDNENIKAASDYQQGIYKDILDKTSMSNEAKMALLQAHASAFKDDAMIAISHQSNAIAAQDLIDKRHDAQRNWDLKATEAGQKTQEFNDKTQIFKDGIKAHPEWTPEQKAAFHAKVFEPSVSAASVRAEATSQKANEKAAKNDRAIDTVIGEIDKAIDKAKNSQTIVEGATLGPTGLQGMAARAAEGLGIGKGADGTAPGAAFKEDVSLIAQQAGEIIHGGRYSNAATKDAEKNLQAIGALTSPATATAGLTELKNHLLALKGKSVDHQNPSGSQYSIGETVTSPDGKKMTITGFDEDGTPLGEEVK